jgi:hypothetical protein
MATDPATIGQPSAQPAVDPNAAVYEALRRADAAGDADAVARLSLYIKQQHAPAPITDSGTTMGFAEDAPAEASRQLSAEDSATFYKMLRGDGMPKATAAELRHFVGSKGLSLDNAEQIVDQRDKGEGVVGQITYPLPKVENTDGPAATTARGAMDTLTFGTLPKLGAGIAGIESAVKGDGFLDRYHEMLDHNNGVVASDQAEHPYYRIAGQLLTGLAIPTGLEGVGFKAGSAALREGASLQEARGVAMAAVRNRMAITGGAYGAAHGAGSADNIPDAIKGAATEGALGATGGLAFGAAGQYIDPAIQASRIAARGAPSSANEAFDYAARRVGDFTGDGPVQYLAADRPDALPSQWATSLTNLTLGGIPLSDAARKVVQSAKDARDSIAAKIGNFRTNEGGSADTIYAGQRLQRGAQAFLNQSEKRADDLYEAIPIAPDRPGVLTNTRAALSDLTKGFTSNEALSKLWADNPRLRATLDALTPEKSPIFKEGLAGGGGADVGATQVGTAFKDGQLSWNDMKRFRSIIGRVIGRPGLEADGDQIDALRKVYAGLSEDMRATASGAGAPALKAFQRANDYFSARQQRISDTLAPIFGKNLDATPEDAYRALLGWSKGQGGDFAAVARTIRSLPEDDANTVRATILNSLGKVSKGRQDETGSVFSPSDFVTHWNDLSDRAKGVLFQGDARKAIDDLVTVASGMKAGAQKFANTSKTGIAIGATGTISGAIAHPLLAPFSIMGQIGAGYLLGKPAFARWLTSYIKKPNAAAALAHIQKLGSIAKTEPAIADDVLQIQQRLAASFAGAPMKAAAQPDSQDKQ